MQPDATTLETPGTHTRTVTGTVRVDGIAVDYVTFSDVHAALDIAPQPERGNERRWLIAAQRRRWHRRERRYRTDREA